MTVRELILEMVEDALELQRDAKAMERLAQRQIFKAQRMNRTIKEKCPELLNLPVSSLAEPPTSTMKTGE